MTRWPVANILEADQLMEVRVGTRPMFRKATIIITLIITVLTLVFILCAFAVILKWFVDPSIADMITRYSGYGILGLGMVLVACMLLDKSNFD